MSRSTDPAGEDGDGPLQRRDEVLDGREDVLERRDPVVERVSDLLTSGTLVVVACVAVGTILVVLAGRTPVTEHGPGLDVARIPGDLVALRPDGWLWLGLLLTVMLPIARVVLALLGFARNGETRLVGISIATLVVLGASVAIALATR